MSIDFTPGIINTYHGDIYNCTTNTDNVKTPDTPKWPCDNWEEQQHINSTFSGEGYNPEQFDLAQHQLQQINACHTNTTDTNADYSKVVWICPYISRHLLSLNPLLACCRRYSRGER